MKSRYGSSMPKLKNPFKKWFIISGGVIVLALLVSVLGDLQRQTVTGKVISKQMQTKISGTDGSISTEQRYLVRTDKEMFVVSNSLINMKYNNSEIYMGLDSGKTYTFVVCGWGKSMITEYRNILSSK
jgi:hypothetical protein